MRGWDGLRFAPAAPKPGVKHSGRIMKNIILILGFLLLPLTGLCQESEVVGEGIHRETDKYKLDIDVSIIGAEAAGKDIASALNNLAAKIEALGNSDKLSQEDKEELIEVVNSINSVTSSFVDAINRSKEPIKDIASSVSLSVSESINSSVSNAATKTRTEIIDPLAANIRMMFWLMVAVIALVIFSAILFVRCYVYPMVKDITTATNTAATTINMLPETIEKIVMKVESSKNA